MAQIDEIKEKLGWLKIIFGILTAIDVSLLGWLAQNYNSANIILLIASLLIITTSTIGIILVNKVAYKNIKELKDL